MTAVEIARTRLARAAARRAAPRIRTAPTSPRHDDSGSQSTLEDASESVLARSMITPADAPPDDIGALCALILVERAERAQFSERIATLERLNTKLEDGRIEIDSNTVERSIRGLALNRKNALFAGHGIGAENWATIASLVETCKLNAVDPLAWMTDTLTRLVNRWPASRIDDLMPWAYAAKDA